MSTKYRSLLVVALATMGWSVIAQAPDSAKAVLDQAGTRRGIGVVLGDPALAIELAKQSELLIYAQSSKEPEVSAARKMADAAGLLGRRVYIDYGEDGRIHLADNLADFIVVRGGATPDTELLRVLRPAGKLLTGGKTVTKPFPKDSDEWAHPYHGPDNNPQSKDQLAKRPFMTHFTAEPWYAAMPQQSVIAGGRIFKAYGHRTSALPQTPMLHMLVAFNAFNGTELWKRELSPTFEIHRNTLIATPTMLYLGDDTSCKRLDAATGKVIDEIVAPKDLSDGPVWKWMALEDGVLYALIGEKEPPVETVRGTRYRGAGWPWWKIPNYSFGYGKTLLAIDASSKKVLWHHRQDEPIDGRSVCLAAGRLFFTSPGKFVAGLELKTGKPLWKNSDAELLKVIGEDKPAQNPFEGFITTAYAKCSDQMVYFAGPMRNNLVAISAKDGKYLWHKDGGNYQLVLRDEALYALAGGRINDKQTSLKLHPVSGEVLSSFASRDRCTRATGCFDTIFTRGGKGGSTAAFDITSESPKMGLVSPMRPACQDGVITAHGQLYWGPWMCRCDFTQIGMMCLAPAGGFSFDAKANNDERLEVGIEPQIGRFDMMDDDWLTYRRDNARSSRMDVAIPDTLKQVWEFKPPAATVATAPVTAGDRVFIGGLDGVVRAVDATSGQAAWTAYTGGGIKYSPAVSRGRVYVGSGDGWIHSFEARSGKPVWRFRGAPIERRVPIFGALQSTWPIGSGVLVENNILYAAAGMFNYDGTHVYALDATTGRIRWQNNTSAQVGPEGAFGPGVQGHLLLHKNYLCLAGGNTAPVAIYDKATGKYVDKGGSGAGKDLYLVGDSVGSSGHPLYWRQEDWHLIVNVELPMTGGSLLVTSEQVALKNTPDGKAKPVWSATPFNENNAVAITKNAVLIAGVQRDESGKGVSALVALNPADGKQLWKQPLPAEPVSFGIAVDRTGRIVVSLQDGRVLCFN